MLLRAVTLLFAVLLSHPAWAERKVALLIGNAAYSAPATVLKNPPNDVAAMKAMLEKAHFDVSVVENAGRAAMSTALADFEAKVEGADVGLIYYSGHGMELLGENFLIPIDAKLASDRVVKYEAIELKHLLETLNGATKLKLVLLDACRDNPFLATMKRTLTKGGLSKGLAPVGSRESNMLVGYATAEGDVALDGTGGTSPYVEALVRHLIVPGQEIEAALRAVAKDVYEATGGKQRPFKTGSMFETVMLVDAEAKPTPDIRPVQPVADLCRDAGAHWSAISGRKDKALLEEHVRLFGTCAFASVAKLEIAALQQGQSGLAVGLQSAATERGNDGKAPETECDRLAARPGDPMKLASVKGIDFDKIRLPEAVTACEAAVSEFPGETRLSYQLGRAQDKSGDYGKAMASYRKAAEGGHAAAMSNIGSQYKDGEGVPQDYSEALSWYRKAAEKGDAAAIANIGVLYRDGQGVAQDYTEAMKWYRKAADGGNAEAMISIGLLYGNGNGVQQDYSEAMKWYRRAANRKNMEAMAKIAVLYENGQGVPQDYKEAMIWYRKAAEGGHGGAMNSIGFLYDEGLGVPRDGLEAARYIEMALRKGWQDSLDQLKINANWWSIEFRKALQQRLKDTGFYKGAVDGQFGPATINAIEAIFNRG